MSEDSGLTRRRFLTIATALTGGVGVAAAAVLFTCASLSAEQGPAMTITSSPPMRTSPALKTVSSCLNVRLASLYGLRIGTTLSTPMPPPSSSS